MTSRNGVPPDPRLGEASEWFVRMRGPDADSARPAFDTWLADPLNAAAYDEITAIWTKTEMGHWAPVVQDHKRKVKQTHAQSVARRRPRAVAALLAVFLLAGTASLVWIRPFGAANVPPTLIASKVGEIRTERLPDGSTVVLDTDTRITLLFSPGERRITLAGGRARFDVAHDSARPFIVEAGGRTITARGTLFDVGLGAGGLDVTLLRGSIDVAPLSRHGDSATVRMMPGQVLHAATPLTAPAIISSSELPRWPEGRLAYEGAPLGRILDDAARYSSRRIRLAEPDLAMLRVTGVFSVRYPDVLADKLAAALGLKAIHSPGEIILTR